MLGLYLLWLRLGRRSTETAVLRSLEEAFLASAELPKTEIMHEVGVVLLYF